MDYHVHRMTILIGVVLFSIVGLFGNISLIALHIRRPKLRTKYGLLISLLSFFQSFCLICEWVGLIYAFSTPAAIRSECFSLIFIFMFAHCMQTGLAATTAVDLLISISFSLLHRFSPNGTYVSVISLPSVLYGILTVIFGFILTDNRPINMCNPPSSLSERVNFFWYAVALAAGAVTVFCYVLSYIILLYKNLYFHLGKRHVSDQSQELARKSMRTLSIILLIFLFTRYMATIGANVLNMTNVNPDVVTLVQSYCVFMAMVCYSQNFYVIFWRSAEYRKHLCQQHMRLHNFLFGKCCPVAKITTFSTTAHHIGMGGAHLPHSDLRLTQLKRSATA